MLANSLPSTSAILRFLIGLVIIGSLMLIIHIPYARIFLNSTFALIAIVYFWPYSAKQTKLPVDHIKVLLVVVWSLSGITRMFHLPGNDLFTLTFWLLAVIWLIMDRGAYFRDLSKRNPYLPNFSGGGWFYKLGVALVVLGALDKFLHLPGADLAIILGLAFAMGSSIYSMFKS